MGLKVGGNDIRQIIYIPAGGGSPIQINGIKMWDGTEVRDFWGTSTTTPPP